MSNYDEIRKASQQSRKFKYFFEFEGKTIQIQNIERIETDEVANQDSFGGEGDCLLFQLILRMKDYPYTVIFDFHSEEARADGLLKLHNAMEDHRISVK